MINNYFEREYQPYHEVYTHECGNKIYIGDITAALDKEFIKNKKITLGIYYFDRSCNCSIRYGTCYI